MLRVVWLLAQLRVRWRTLVVLALLIGIGGGASLTALAGARRTDSAVSRMAAYSLPDQGGFMYAGGSSAPSGDPYSATLRPAERAVVDLPQVAAWYRLPAVYLSTEPTGGAGSNLNVIVSPDADFFHTVDRPLLVSGRLPAADRPDEAAVNELAARDLHVRVGDQLPLYAYSAGQIRALSKAAGGGAGFGSGPPGAPAGPRLAVTITGVYRLPADVSAVGAYTARQGISYEAKDRLYLAPAFLTRLARRISLPIEQFPYADMVSVRLRHGMADFASFSKDAVATGRGRVFVGDPGDMAGTAAAAASASRATRLEALSLLLFGTVALLITVLLVGQGISRQMALHAGDHSALRALGATRRQLFGAAMTEAGVTAGAGALMAAAIAAASSSLMPIGLARQAEIHPGVDIDIPVLAGGAALLALLVILWSAPPAWKAARDAGRPSAALRARVPASSLTRIVRSPAARAGIRFGLERGAGRRAVPVAGALVAAVVAVAALSASLTFSSSLSHLNSSPRQQGWNWDVLIGNPNDVTDRRAQYSAVLSGDPLVGSYSAIAVIAGARQGNAYIGKVPLGIMLAFDPMKGSVLPTLLAGRPPHGTDEIVLGATTLSKLHKRVGDTVQMDVGPPVGKLTLRVVGSMISPSAGDIFTNSLGDGAWISGRAFEAVQARIPPAGTDSAAPPQSVFGLFAVRYAPGASPTAAFASLQRRFGPIVLRRLPPADIIDLRSVQSLPLLLAALIALLGLGTIGHSLVTSVRRRRPDLALLKTIGFVRRQVAATVAWQATSFVVVALALGVPIGLAAGRWAWHLVASGIHSPSPPVVPAVALVLIGPAFLCAANVLAAVPGLMAARISPSVVLREE